MPASTLASYLRTSVLRRHRLFTPSPALLVSSSLPLLSPSSLSSPHSRTLRSAMSTTTYKYVVVGAGNAAGYAAAQFVKNGLAPNDLCIIGDEPVEPYERPALSKAVLVNPKVRLPGFHTCVGGGGDRQTTAFYSDNGIAMKLSTRVTAVDAAKRTAVLDNGDTVEASTAMIMATGANPIRLTRTPGHDLGGIFYLRNNAEAMQLFDGLQAAKGKKVAIIGGGYIGMEVAAAAITVGCDVSMIFPETHMMSRLFTPEIAKPYEEMYEAKGVKYVKDGALAKAFLPDSSGTKVRAVSVAREGKSEEEIEADLVVVGVGARAETSLLKDQVTMDRFGGIVVDSSLQSSVNGVYAIGDIATFPLLMYGDRPARMEHVQNCRDMAKHVVNAITKPDEKTPYDYLPYFYSRVFHLSWQFFGDSSGECIVIGSMDGKALAEWTSESGPHPQLLSVWVTSDSQVEGVFMESPTKEDTENMKKIARARPTVTDMDALKACSTVEEGWKLLLSL